MHKVTICTQQGDCGEIQTRAQTASELLGNALGNLHQDAKLNGPLLFKAPGMPSGDPANEANHQAEPATAG